MSLKYIDPELAIHPLRNELTDDDWDRLDRIFQGAQEECSIEELDAYQDWIYDVVVSKLQTHDGVTTLQ